jgi:hypothetical protein
VKSDLPLEIPAWGSAVVVFALTPNAFADTFSVSVPLFIDDGTLAEVHLSIEGRVVKLAGGE